MSFGETFLAFPDLFPARRAGEPWGERRVSLELPGGPYALAGLSADQAEAARERFGDLCREGEPEPAAVHGLLFRAPPDDFREVDTRGWEYAMDFDHGERAVRLAGLRLMARLDWTPDLAGGLWTSEEGELFPGICENFLRVLVAYRLLALGGVVLHSAGIATGAIGDEGAYLFLGPSGAGKTTLSRLSQERGHAVLSDDLNALVPGEPPQVVKLPFTGDLGDRREAHPPRPLSGLLRLAKGPEDALRPLSPGETLALLYACSPFVNADPHRREALLDVLSGLARALPPAAASELTFSLAGSFWDILTPRSP